MNSDRRLSAGIKLRFGVGDFGMSAITACLQFYMLFYYTDVVKIDPAVAGTAILVGKLTWDMVNDVLFGDLADKTSSRWCRRRIHRRDGRIISPTGISSARYASSASSGKFKIWRATVSSR